MVVQFGKDYYHRQGAMFDWCQENFGKGWWSSGEPDTWEGIHGTWVIWSMFGNTFFAFRHDRDAVAFRLKWC